MGEASTTHAPDVRSSSATWASPRCRSALPLSVPTFGSNMPSHPARALSFGGRHDHPRADRRRSPDRGGRPRRWTPKPWDRRAGSASSIRAAREFMAQDDLDVVLVDLRLPDGSGTELLRGIADPGGPAFIVLSSFS